MNMPSFGTLPPEPTFQLQEAVALINHEVISTDDKNLLPHPPTDKVGIVVGVLWLNDEVEIVIKFPDKIAQLTKSEYQTHFVLVE